VNDDANSEYKSLADVVGMDDDRLARMNEAAWKLYNERRYREAAAVFRGLTVLDPEAVEFYRGLSLAAVKDNDLLAASEALEAACALLAY
jgi:hypothetical protein